MKSKGSKPSPEIVKMFSKTNGLATFAGREKVFQAHRLEIQYLLRYCSKSFHFNSKTVVMF